jgi:hypothetical protein
LKEKQKEEDVVRERMIGLKEIAEFNIKQSKEQKERELNEKERNELEWNGENKWKMNKLLKPRTILRSSPIREDLFGAW